MLCQSYSPLTADGRHDHGSQVRIHLVRRNDNAGAHLLDLTADCRIELRQPDFACLHHQTQSSSTSLETSGQTNSLSPELARR